jgi:Tol biopolymer transport system component
VLISVGASPSSAAFRGRNGRIAYEFIGDSENYQIYSATPRGAKRRKLTHRRFNSSPAYSPSGKRIVFVRSVRNDELWTMRSDGSHKRKLTYTKHVAEDDPAWSPDGEQIVFAVAWPTSLRGIWVVGADGRHRRRLTSGADESPSWSPDGAEIAFIRFTSPGIDYSSIFVVPSQGGTPTALSTDPSVSDFAPDWSPDGSRIVFGSTRPDNTQADLWMMNRDGSDPRRVTNTPNRDEDTPAWSPDGRWIVYSGIDNSDREGTTQLYVSRPDGSRSRIITHSCPECGYINDEPSWQPLR